MYNPDRFQIKDTSRIKEVMKKYGFATVISQQGDGLVADHLPIFFEDLPNSHGRLLGHVSRANPLWKVLESGAPILTIFQGPHCYVSPTYQSNEQRLLKAIVAFEIKITKIEAKFKLNQDEIALTRQQVIKELRKGDDQQKAIANLMERNEGSLS